MVLFLGLTLLLTLRFARNGTSLARGCDGTPLASRTVPAWARPSTRFYINLVGFTMGDVLSEFPKSPSVTNGAFTNFDCIRKLAAIEK
jgi:hypothetical protein